MATTNGSGGYTNERLDRIEAILEKFAANDERFQQQHDLFLQDHQILLKAQVVMQDSLQKLWVLQQDTGEKLNILVATVDDMIRRQSK